MRVEDRFARLAALRPTRGKELRVPRGTEPPAEGDCLAALVGARINRNQFGEHLSLRQWYATPEMCSPDADSLSLLLPQLGSTDSFLADALHPEKWLFLDTETTGLAGGTGTYAFMVGIAWWEAGGLEVEQFFLRDLDEEYSLLFELSERIAERPVLVTFNGKSFDWPLLETRYRMTRGVPAFTPKVHLDLLHPARQLWRLRLGSVRLKDLERHVLGRDGRSLDWSRRDDIDSSLIPQMYFDYLRGGPAAPIAGIFHHNQMDLRGLAALAGRIFELLDCGRNANAGAERTEARDPIEVLGLSQLMRKRGEAARARELYEEALQGGLPGSVERLAQRELDYARANSLWHVLRGTCRPGKRGASPLLASALLAEDERKALETAIEASEQLAIHYEHRAKDPHRALEFIREAIIELRTARREGAIARNLEEKVHARLARRMARLERRCAGCSPPL